VFSIAALVPSPPVLVPELCGGRSEVAETGPAAEVARVRAAALAAAGELAGVGRWTVVGVDTDGAGQPAAALPAVSPVPVGVDHDSAAVAPSPVRELGPETAGTFRGFGADVTVALSPAAPTAEPDPCAPLPVLIAAWLRGRIAPGATASALLIAPGAAPAACLAAGERLRAALDAEPEPHGVLVVADGATTLSTGAPGYFRPEAPRFQRGLDDALDAGDRAALRALDPGLCAELGVGGRAAHQALAGLFGPDAADPVVRTYYRDAPFGVGYHVSVWRQGDDREGRSR